MTQLALALPPPARPHARVKGRPPRNKCRVNIALGPANPDYSRTPAKARPVVAPLTGAEMLRRGVTALRYRPLTLAELVERVGANASQRVLGRLLDQEVAAGRLERAGLDGYQLPAAPARSESRTGGAAASSATSSFDGSGGAARLAPAVAAGGASHRMGGR